MLQLNGACAKDIFNTFSADATGFMNYTLLYWGACSAQTIATEMGYPPAPTSVLPAEKAEQWNALIYGSAPAPAPTPELGVDPTDAAAAQAAVAAAASATAATAAAGLHAVKAAEGP